MQNKIPAASGDVCESQISMSKWLWGLHENIWTFTWTNSQSSSFAASSQLVSQLCAKSGVPMPLEQKTWLQNKVLQKEPLPPWVFRMERFQEKKENDEEWYSDPVYSYLGGYKMCLCGFADGNRNGRGIHVSVLICLMRDDDDNLKLPFKGTIKMSLLNQLENGQHHTGQT